MHLLFFGSSWWRRTLCNLSNRKNEYSYDAFDFVPIAFYGKFNNHLVILMASTLFVIETSQLIPCSHKSINRSMWWNIFHTITTQFSSRKERKLRGDKFNLAKLPTLSTNFKLHSAVNWKKNTVFKVHFVFIRVK